MIGHNRPEPASVADWLAVEYSLQEEDAQKQLSLARSLPEVVEDDDDLAKYTVVITGIRTVIKNGEAARVKEKDPYLKTERAIDAFFKGIETRLAKAAGVLERRVHEHQMRKLAEERRRREQEAAEREREADEARKKMERARSIEKVAEREIEAHLADMRAQQADAMTQAKPADMVRTRVEGGPLVTASRVPFVDVTDYDKLDLEKLRPYIARDALMRAVRAWARLTNHQEKMDGAIIEMRDATVIR